MLNCYDILNMDDCKQLNSMQGDHLMKTTKTLKMLSIVISLNRLT